MSSSPDKSKEPKALPVAAGYANLALSFEPNRGQTDSRVKFISRAGNRTLWLTKDEAVLDVGRTSQVNAPGIKHAPELQNSQLAPAILRMKFAGANPDSVIAGENRQPGLINYFAGKPSEWLTKIPTYARVRYHGLYPGIDLVFYGNNRELEYDLVVSPGADPRRIKLALTGADKTRIDNEGNLVLETPAGEVIQQKPRIYQRSGTALKPIAGGYVMVGKNEVGFQLGNYDRQAGVVIDPVLRYSTFLGGSGIDEGRSIAVDSHNRAVVAGITCSPDFPATDGNTPPPPGVCAAFISKLDFTGTHLVFSTFIADSSSPPRIALDSSDNIYVTAGTVGNPTHFPVTPGAFQTKPGGLADAYATKLNSTGTALVYSTFLGGSDFEVGSGIAVDASGNAYVTGATASKNFPTTAGAFQRECNLKSDGSCFNAFVTKLNAMGSQELYSTFLGGHETSGGGAIAVNGAGNAFVAGGTSAADFPTTAGSAQPVFAGGGDAFVAEFSASGSHLIYSTFLGGTDSDGAGAIALDQFGNAVIAGTTSSTDFPVKNAFQPHCNGPCNLDGFAAKLSPTGKLVYSTYLGGVDNVALAGMGTSIAVTPGGQAYVTGFTQSSKFPTTQNAFQRVFGGFNDIFLTKFSPTGKVIFSSYLGGNDSDLDPAVALDHDANAYVTGGADFLTISLLSNFPITPGAFQQSPGGRGDAFVAKVVSLCALSTVNRSVTICSPGSNSVQVSPVRVTVGTTDATPVKLTQIYIDGQKVFEARLSAISVSVPLSVGGHRLTVQALDTANVLFKKVIGFTVIR